MYPWVATLWFFSKGDTFSICGESIHKAMRLYGNLGFVINFKKVSNCSNAKDQNLSLCKCVNENDGYTYPRKEAKTKNLSFKFTQN